MIPGFAQIVEERIQKALRDGEFDNLPGAGKPLELADDSHVPEDLRLAYKILKNADCMPPEIELKKEIHRTEDLLSNMEDTTEKFQMLKKLNFLIMKLNTIRGGSSFCSTCPKSIRKRLSTASNPKNRKKGVKGLSSEEINRNFNYLRFRSHSMILDPDN